MMQLFYDELAGYDIYKNSIDHINLSLMYN